MTRRLPATVIATALLALYGQLALVLHLALVDHQRCPAHGEVVHTASAHTASAHTASAHTASAHAARAHAARAQPRAVTSLAADVVLPENSAGARVDAGDAEPASADDHCLAAALRTAAAAPRPGRAAAATIPATAAAADRLRPAVTPPVAIAALALAPKHGPPATTG